jgi:cytochrome c peroxidase
MVARGIIVKPILVLLLTISGALADDAALLKRSQAMFKPIPAKAPVLKTNPASPERVDLGKLLYFDPRLSSSWLISCNTCHNLSLAGVDLLETSIGHGWQKGPRNSPTVLNAVLNIAQFWDGRARDLKEQAMGPVQAAVEMNSTPDRTVRTLKSIPEYVERFKKSFPGETDPVTFENMARAIEVFEATLLTPNSKFDQFLGGNVAALNASEKQGLDLFITKGCVPCHMGVNFGGQGYFPFGVVERPGADILPQNDKGRFAVTRTATDEYAFKSPSLRNIALTAPYFHSGKVWDLKQAVAIMGTAQLRSALTDAEVESIVTFLKTLTGDQPRVDMPILPPHTKDTPLPNTRVTQTRH